MQGRSCEADTHNRCPRGAEVQLGLGRGKELWKRLSCTLVPAPTRHSAMEGRYWCLNHLCSLDYKHVKFCPHRAKRVTALQPGTHSLEGVADTPAVSDQQSSEPNQQHQVVGRVTAGWKRGGAGMGVPHSPPTSKASTGLCKGLATCKSHEVASC